MRRALVITCIAVLMILVLRVPVASAQACQIGLVADPPVVHYPGALPSPSGEPKFGEIFDANYSSPLVGQQVTLQYQDGSRWVNLQTFLANPAGFTETTVGLDTSWTKVGQNTVRALIGSCQSATAGFEVSVDNSAVPADLLVYVLLVLLGVALFLLGKYARLGVFMVVATAVYLVIAPYTGQRYDIYFLASSGIRVLQHVNPFDPGPSNIYPSALKWAYPPLYAVYSAVSYQLYQLFTGATLPSASSLIWPGYMTSTYNVWEAFVPMTLPTLVLFLKLPMVVSAIGTAILLRRMTGRKSAAVQWLLNPLVILVTAVWGQLDPIATFFALASLYSYNRNRPYHAYFLASMGAAVKLWPVLLIPMFLAGSARREGRRAVKPVAAALPAAVASLGLYAAYGSLVQTLFVFVFARGIPTFAGRFTVNGLTWQQVLFALHSPPVPLFLILGIPLYLIILVHIYRKGDMDVARWLIVSILIFYLTYNYVNPQYFYWILPFLILQGRRAATWLFTALPMAYVALSYDIFYFVSPALLLHEFSIGPSIVEQLKLILFYSTPIQYIVVSAAIPTIAYVLLLRHELSRKKTKSPQPPAAERQVSGSAAQRMPSP